MCDRRSILSRAVAAAVLVSASSLLAQYQVENSAGRARDANNRLGSGGYNDTRALPNGVTSDDIVYGNVTRGREFRGQINSTDSRAFRGQTAGRGMDNFVRDSGGVPLPGARPGDELQPGQYLGDSRGVNPPADYRRESLGTGGFVPATPAAGPVAGDLRLNAAIANPALDDLTYSSRSASDAARLRRGSPLAAGLSPVVGGAGVTWAPVGGVSDREIQEMSRGTLRRLNISQQTLRSMREEVEQSATEEAAPGMIPGALPSPEKPANPSLDSQLKSEMNPGVMGGSLRTASGVRQNLLSPLPAATLQSSQYAELRRRLKAYQDQGLITEDQAAAQEYNAQFRLQQERARETEAGVAVTPPAGETPAVKTAKSTESTPLTPPAHGGRRAAALGQRTPPTESGPGFIAKPEGPMRVTSFAEGIKAPRLKAMMEGAEKAMREGKFTGALDQYDAAAAVAPNNPIILMGRANAELGAGYYARAQAHIEQIFQSDQAMLLAQYDLKRFFGEDRLQYLVRDLKDVAKNEPGESRPLFLLAYIAYNTNNPQRAADYLAAAEQRAGKSALYDRFREFWNLPKAQAGGQEQPDAK